MSLIGGSDERKPSRLEQDINEALEAANAPQLAVGMSIRRYLASQFGDAWLKCSLQANEMEDGHTIYTALLMESVEPLDQVVPVRTFHSRMYTIDRDRFGQWYIAKAFPVKGRIV